MTYQTVKKLAPRDVGYLAGLIDGEGTITLSRRNLNKYRALVITVSNTEMSILKYVQEITGVGKITNKRITKANHTPSFTFQVANRQALATLGQFVNTSNLIRPPVPTWLLKNTFAYHLETAVTPTHSSWKESSSLSDFWASGQEKNDPNLKTFKTRPYIDRSTFDLTRRISQRVMTS